VITALSRARAGLLVVDIQERLAAAMAPEVIERVVKNTTILIEAAHRLGLPIAVSQQYPKGLGPTLPAIEAALASAPGGRRIAFDKLEFSAAAHVPADRDQWIVCGMETHVCVYQTARGLVDRGRAVHVVVDAACSRTKQSWQIGLGLCERAGAFLTTTEACVFDLLERAGTDDFKALSKLVK
jgi:nicotinamidase-related amidase